MENNNKEITIDDLAGMMKRGFDHIDERFDQVDKRFEQVDKRFDNIENKVNQIDKRLFSIEEDVAEIKIKKHTELEKRVGLVERKLGMESAA